MSNDTVSQLGCATLIAVVAFVVGGIGSFFFDDATLAERGLVAIGIAAAAFIAAWLLARDDSAQQNAARESVRQMLADRQGISDDEYAAQFPDTELALVMQVRNAVAEFFDVEVAKILSTDDLRRDYQYALGWGVEVAVIESVCAERGLQVPPFYLIRDSEVTNVATLTEKMKRILDDIASSSEQGGAA